MTDEPLIPVALESMDDIEVEVAPVQVLPPVAPKESALPEAGAVAAPKEKAESPASERTERSAARKMALRVPDDEVSRSPSSRRESAPPPSVESNAAPMMPTRIISVGPPPSLNSGIPASAVLPSGSESVGGGGSAPTLLRGPSPSNPPASEVPASRRPMRTLTDSAPEDSWTPYQPTVADQPPRLPIPPVAPARPAPPATLSEDAIQVDTDFDSVPPSVRDAGDRKSDPGDAPEIAPEDLVSVESVAAAAAAVEIASMARAKGMSVPPPPPPTVVVSAPPPTAVPPVRPKLITLPPPSTPGVSTPGPPSAVTSPKPPLVIVPPHVGSTPPAADKRKPRLWWDEMFGDDLLRTLIDISDADILKEVDFIEDSLGIAKGGALLDLGCGTGRHAIELSRRGYEVVGLDMSLGMLAQASDLAQNRGEKLNFIQGDMREMTFDAVFDGVYCWNTTFGYFEEEKNALAVSRMHKALKKGGQLLLDVINRDFVVRQAPSLAWFEGEGCVCMDEMQIDWITSRMRVKRTMMLDDGRTREVEYSIRVYSLHELGRILHEQGFRVCEVSGRISTPGVFFGNESPRTLILAEKR